MSHLPITLSQILWLRTHCYVASYRRQISAETAGQGVAAAKEFQFLLDQNQNKQAPGAVVEVQGI